MNNEKTTKHQELDTLISPRQLLHSGVHTVVSTIEDPKELNVQIVMAQPTSLQQVKRKNATKALPSKNLIPVIAISSTCNLKLKGFGHFRLLREVHELKRLTKQQKMFQVEVSQKKQFSAKKVRTNLPKRCGDEKCIAGQYFSTLAEAVSQRENFNTRKGRTTYCPCGETVQYYIDGKWLRSGGLSKHLANKYK